MDGRRRYGMGAACAQGALVAAVDRGSPAARAGVRVGDIIDRANGHLLRDLVDWLWHTDGPAVSLLLLRPDSAGDSYGRTGLELTRAPGEAWGIEFAEVVFDGVRTCVNSCAFCFMSQLPPGLRRALYVRDDDYRLSFLQGNFVTLTNLDDTDVRRIVQRRLSPLYVSLHAVTPRIRERLVCARGTDRALEVFDTLVEAGIETHVQIVAVPGVNDQDELDTTLSWLAAREGVRSVGVVPLGYTAHQERYSASYEDRAAASGMIERVQPWQLAMRQQDGVTWVYLADEFYLNACAPFPSTEWYDSFPQYENGIGIVPAFVEEMIELKAEFTSALLAMPETESVTLVTGELAASTLAGALEAVGGVGKVRLLATPNRLFGGNVTVAGLLTGTDIVTAIAADAMCGQTAYVAPDVMLNADGVTLDDMTVEDIRAATNGTDVAFVDPRPAGLLGALRRAAC
ncbi:MAG: DUF512 domain-containing protein [Clostridiales bacterium]|nr:DUF512 domain-containing protein [Clostridiales bacterium]